MSRSTPPTPKRVSGTAGIWITPHYGNFEWIALMMGFRGVPFHVVAQDFKNPHLTELFRRRREHSGHEVIPQERAMIRLLKVLERGGHAAFLSDLTVKPSKAATVIECFGFQTCVTLLHAVLVDRLGAQVVAGIGIPQPDGTYLMRAFEGPEIEEGASLQEIAQACWDVFEPHLREFPEPWLWMYKHWRFRRAGRRASAIRITPTTRRLLIKSPPRLGSRPSKTMKKSGLILKIDCPDRPGIVAKLASYASLHGGNLTEFSQFTDSRNGRFFARLEIDTANLDVDEDDFIAGFGTLGRGLDARWHFRKLRTACAPP